MNTKDRLLSYSLIRTPDSIVLCRGTRLKMQKIFDKQLEDSLLIPGARSCNHSRNPLIGRGLRRIQVISRPRGMQVFVSGRKTENDGAAQLWLYSVSITHRGTQVKRVGSGAE